MKKNIALLIFLGIQSHFISCSNIIFLNGLSSVGKSSIVKALQENLDTPHIAVSMDILMSHMPSYFIECACFKREGVYFNQIEKDGHKIVDISFGTYGKTLYFALPNIVKALADAGNNIIIELTLAPIDLTPQFVIALKDHAVFFVGLTCPLEIIEQREKERPDRMEGLARGQYETVHAHKSYDLFIDTSEYTPQEIADTIIKTFKKNPHPTHFQKNN